MTTELEPGALANCPFCGKSAVHRETIEHYGGPNGTFSCQHSIACDECGVVISEEHESEAVAAWNRRALSAPEAAHPGAATSENVVAYIDKAGLSLLAGGKSVTVWASPFHMLDGHNSIPLSIAPSATPRPPAPTDGDIGALIERLNAAYEKVATWPESRMQPDAVEQLGDGFIDLLKLRNLVPEAASALAAMSAKLADAERKSKERLDRCWRLSNRAETAEAKLAEVNRQRDHFHEGYVRLTNELTDERSVRSDQNRQAAEALATAEATNTDLRRRVDAMREALEPFAALGNGLPTPWLDHETHWANLYSHITIGQLRAAARASGGSDA